MIGLIVLVLAGTWLFLAGRVARKVAHVLLPGRFAATGTVLLFPCVVGLPFLDEFIGRWQFNALCEREAKVWVAPDAQQVVAARSGDSTSRARTGFIIPISEQPITYFDAVTGKPFYTAKAFHTPGGAIMRAGLNLGSDSSCWPKNWTPRENGLNIDALLQRGKALQGHGARP